MTGPMIDLAKQHGPLAQLLLHTISVSGEEARLLDSLPRTTAANEWLDTHVAWIAANPAAWQRVDFNWEF